MSIFLNIYQKEKGFFWTGLVGIVLGLIGIIFLLTQGNEIPPEGEWTKAITFDLAIGIFSLTIAVLLPFIEMNSKQRKWFVYPLIASFWIAYAIETIQNARGFDPRFTTEGLPIDRIIGLILGIDSVLIMLCMGYFMVIVFQKSVGEYPLLLLSIRYACLSILFAFFSGMWMIALQGRMTPDGLDIMVLHFVGFHGFQAIPVVGWFMDKRNRSSSVATKKIVHMSGIAWLVFCLLLLVQVTLGYSVYQFSFILVLAILAFVVWVFTAIYSFIQYIQQEKVKGENYNV